MNYVISSGFEFADGCRIRGHDQILRNLGSCPPCLEFGAIGDNLFLLDQVRGTTFYHYKIIEK